MDADSFKTVAGKDVDFSAMTDRELMLSLHFRISAIFNSVEQVIAEITPLVDNIKNGPLGGMLGL